MSIKDKIETQLIEQANKWMGDELSEGVTYNGTKSYFQKFDTKNFTDEELAILKKGKNFKIGKKDDDKYSVSYEFNVDADTTYLINIIKLGNSKSAVLDISMSQRTLNKQRGGSWVMDLKRLESFLGDEKSAIKSNGSVTTNIVKLPEMPEVLKEVMKKLKIGKKVK